MLRWLQEKRQCSEHCKASPNASVSLIASVRYRSILVKSVPLSVCSECLIPSSADAAQE